MKNKTKPVLAILALLLVVVMLVGLTRLVRKYTPSSEVMDPMEYFALDSDKEAAIIVDGEVLSYKGEIQDDICYVDYQAVKGWLNDHFYWDAGENTLIYTTPEEIISIPAEQDRYVTEGKDVDLGYVIAHMDGEVTYIALDFVKRYTGISYEMFHDPERIVIQKEEGAVTLASIRKNAKVRYKGGIKSPILREVAKNEVVMVLENMDDWTCIMTQDGYRGYIRTDKLTQIHEETRDSDYTAPEYTSIKKNFKINLVWHQISNMDSNYSLIYDIANVKSVNVISPTWYSIMAEDGTLNSFAYADYVDIAHNAGMEVWALIDNFSTEIDFAKVMNTTASRTKVENQLLASAIEYGIDGINVDFEAISEDAIDGYIQFMRELSVKCRNNGIVLSVDVPPPTYTAYYNREALGEVCDYVIIMGYDEHYFGSETAGSVASLSYVEEGITETLKEVAADKVVNAIPFYTRLWETVTNEDGTTTVTSEAMGMNAAQQTLINNQVESSWDETTSQNYVSFEGAGGSLYEMWLEDEESLTKKLELLKKYDLAGVAAWKLGLEDDSVWDLIEKYVK